MITIGLTGGIGSGKSYVSHIFEWLGADVYNADKEAKALMLSDLSLKEKIRTSFGESAYNPDETLNREYLASVIFSDDSKREELNGLVHPVLLNHYFDFVRKSTKEVVVIEAAILIESGFYKFVDRVVMVQADCEVRLCRTKERDKIAEEQVRGRMAAQMDDIERERYADDTIVNDGKTLLLPQILSILEKIIKCS